MEEFRQLKPGKYTNILVDAEVGEGNANHKYRIVKFINETVFFEELGIINFQNGPIQESGVNGIMDEDLIKIVIDRMQGFQSGKFACRENALALTKLEEALMWLEKRTSDREARGVEGTHTV